MPITPALLQKIQIPEVGRLTDYVIQNNSGDARFYPLA